MAVIVTVGFVLYPYFENQKGNSLVPISIIIAAKNEVNTIEKCLTTILSQNFPKELLEIILVDDGSLDATSERALEILKLSGIKYQIIKNEEPLGKKESLKKAITQSSYELIISRDADTFTRSNEWLNEIVNYHLATKKEFIISPIAVENNKTFLGTLQEVETCILSLFTISSSYFKIPFLCSGANLAFTKKLFYETKAYQNHLHIPSGDDVFFLEDVKKVNVSCIGYLKSKSAIVYTYPEKSGKDLLSQKIRWSGKVYKSASLINWFTAAIIALSNFTWLWALFYAVFYPQNAIIGLFFVFAKLLIDILLVFLASSFIRIKAKSPVVLIVGCFYPVYASVIAVLATLMKPKWKSS